MRRNARLSLLFLMLACMVSSARAAEADDPAISVDDLSPAGFRLVKEVIEGIENAVTDLPLPDSPTNPTVAPSGTANEMPSTARTRGRSCGADPGASRDG